MLVQETLKTVTATPSSPPASQHAPPASQPAPADSVLLGYPAIHVEQQQQQQVACQGGETVEQLSSEFLKASFELLDVRQASIFFCSILFGQ